MLLICSVTLKMMTILHAYILFSGLAGYHHQKVIKHVRKRFDGGFLWILFLGKFDI